MGRRKPPAGAAHVTLAHRNYGVHSPQKTVVLHVPFDKLVSPSPGGQYDDPIVDEAALIAALPSGFLPCDARRVLLMVEGSGIGKPVRFRPWGKYFPTFSLDVHRGDT